ncbi:hypothetical protein HDE_04052 [Halotydeus destructor]|nr:hypothetical protein HDE_04052 [Halotydeus destructor]
MGKFWMFLLVTCSSLYLNVKAAAPTNLMREVHRNGVPPPPAEAPDFELGKEDYPDYEAKSYEAEPSYSYPATERPKELKLKVRRGRRVRKRRLKGSRGKDAFSEDGQVGREYVQPTQAPEPADEVVTFTDSEGQIINIDPNSPALVEYKKRYAAYKAKKRDYEAKKAEYDAKKAMYDQAMIEYEEKMKKYKETYGELGADGQAEGVTEPVNFDQMDTGPPSEKIINVEKIGVGNSPPLGQSRLMQPEVSYAQLMAPSQPVQMSQPMQPMQQPMGMQPMQQQMGMQPMGYGQQMGYAPMGPDPMMQQQMMQQQMMQQQMMQQQMVQQQMMQQMAMAQQMPQDPAAAGQPPMTR